MLLNTNELIKTFFSRTEDECVNPNEIECFNTLPNTFFKERAKKQFRELFEPENSYYTAGFSVIIEIMLMSYGAYAFDLYMDYNLINAYSSQEADIRNATINCHNKTDISEENYYETSNSSLNGDLSNMTFNCNNITDNPENYRVARTISWILIVISIFTYAFLTITYFQVLESLTKLFKSGLCCVRNPTDGTVVGRGVTYCCGLCKFLLGLFNPIIYPFAYAVRYVKAKTNPNNFGQNQRYEDCRRLWDDIKRVETGVESTGQLILQLWLVRPYFHIISNWTSAEAKTHLWTGFGHIFSFATKNVSYLDQMVAKFFVSILITCLSITWIRVRKSYDTDSPVSIKGFIYLCACFCQLIGRLMTIKLFFIIDMDKKWHLVWIILHIMIEFCCIKLMFECPPLKNKKEVRNNDITDYLQFIMFLKLFETINSFLIKRENVHT